MPPDLQTLPIVNVAAYKFATLRNLTALRSELRDLTAAHQLLGTILLSPEGINLFVAGERGGIDMLLARIRAIPEIGDLPVKESFSPDRPFSRMVVKIKREIIAFGVDGIEPARHTARRISAAELKKWLDENRPITLLDTRNNFEVQAGTFTGAVPIDLEDFRDFPLAVGRLPNSLKSQPIVTFCTGGIRCEKAAPYLERAGFTEVYQLDGGILKYFEEIGAAHFQGDCFVFDKRVALDANLRESNLRQCYMCQAVLTLDEQASPKYVEGRSCPQCYRSETEARDELLQRRQQAIYRETHPLPGSAPYNNVRPVSVPLRFDGRELLEFLEGMRLHLSQEQWRLACDEGRLLCRGVPVKPGRIMRAGERLFHHVPATSEPDVAGDFQILHEDEAIVVVNKSAPLPMHPCGRYNRNTLLYLLNRVYHPLHLRPAHRLDADTTGVVVFSKSREIAGTIQPQFENGGVRKTYLARVHGTPAEDHFECHWSISTGPTETGIRLPDENGAPAHTRCRVLNRLADGTTLLEVKPLTGRTNQIRVHLWKQGFPIVGDPIYQRYEKLGTSQALSIGDDPLCLHAATIEFTHPLTSELVQYEAIAPAWALSQSIAPH